MKEGKEHFKNHPKHQNCDFGIKVFNKAKRDRKFIEEINESSRRAGKKPPRGGTSGGVSTGGVIFLDFDGHLISNTSWNYAGDINAAPSGLTWDEQQLIIDNCMQDYAAFNVVVTADVAVYNATPIDRRIRCLITETWEWFGQAGGVAFIDSFFSPTDEPCFVFSSLLGYNNKKIREAVSHEVGHTLGLYHQSSYDANCLLVSEYNYGANGEAPIMGVGYYQPDVHWWIGPTHDCNTIQDDAQVLAARLGLKS